MIEIELNWKDKRKEVRLPEPSPTLERVAIERPDDALQISPTLPVSQSDNGAQEDLFSSLQSDALPSPSQISSSIRSANQLILGDNFKAMCALLSEFAGKFDLIYLDPPFFTRRDWKNREDEHAYADTWDEGLPSYLQFLYDRLFLAREALSDNGCLYLHLDWQAGHYAKLILDEIFGAERFQNEIIWCYREAINSRKRWNRKHDTILFYSKTESFTFNPETVLEPYSESTLKKFRSRDEKGPYRLMGRGITNSPLRSKRDLSSEMESLYPELTYRHYLGEGTLPVDYWFIDIENQASHVRTGYPTQKPEALLEKILLASTNPGDLIGDFFCGSGTTLSVANRLERRWIGVDSGELAIKTTEERLSKQGATFEMSRVKESSQA